MAGSSTLRGLAGRCLAGRYELREPIGSGGMASVWLAEDSRLERPVAVKLLAEALADDPVFGARFRREAQVAASLTHPNLVGVYDFNADHEPPFLVMEYVAGPDLAERMGERHAIDVERLAGDLLAALGAIHRAGVIHRDVKPHNVLIATDGRAQLTDFGIARGQEATSITQTGQMPGTARYMAPELMRGEPATPSSDLYSCGVVLRDCLSTEPTRGTVDLLAERLCDPDPARRPASAAAALDELGVRGAEDAATAVQRIPPPFDPHPPRTKNRAGPSVSEAARRLAATPRPPALAALAGIAILVVILIVSSGGDEGEGGGALLGGAQQREADAPATERDGEGGAGGGETRSESAQAASGAPVDPARGTQLDAQGRSLIDQGRPEEAIPVLERAVASFPEGSDDINYAYALFNLGNALRLAGRPEEAIPVLRERLRYPDQVEVVRQELAAAREAAD